MLKLNKMVPQVYYNKSRDFQLIGRIIEFLFNYSKNNVDLLSQQVIDSKKDTKLLNLLCTTIGFEIKHEYNNEQLSALCSVFLLAIHNKGSKKAIQIILDLLTALEGGRNPASMEIGEDGILYLYISEEISDITILKNVFDYIMPAGFNYIVVNNVMFNSDSYSNIGNRDVVRADVIDNSNMSIITKLNNQGTQEVIETELTSNGAVEKYKIDNQYGIIPSAIDNLSLRVPVAEDKTKEMK